MLMPGDGATTGPRCQALLGTSMENHFPPLEQAM
jgi:hypothetical protein